MEKDCVLNDFLHRIYANSVHYSHHELKFNVPHTGH